MTNENEAMSELSSVLDRINLRLDAMEKEDKGMPEGLKEHMEDKKDKKEDKAKEMAEGEDDKKEGMYGGGEHKMAHGDMAKGEYSDVITEDYLNWMENTLKSAGVDTDGARLHFDQLSKANLGSTPESIGDGAEYFGGQVKGRAQENGSPSTNAIGKLNSGSGEVAKSFLSPSDLTPAQVEEAYEAYKAASVEKQLKSSLGAVFADRLAKEQRAEVESRRASEFDARGPLASIEKAVAALSERIDGLATGEGATLRKSEAAPSITVPSTEDMANMSWDEVHQLAGRAFN